MRNLVASLTSAEETFLAYFCTCIFVAAPTRTVIMNGALFQQSPSRVLNATTTRTASRTSQICIFNNEKSFARAIIVLVHFAAAFVQLTK